MSLPSIKTPPCRRDPAAAILRQGRALSIDFIAGHGFGSWWGGRHSLKAVSCRDNGIAPSAGGEAKKTLDFFPLETAPIQSPARLSTVGTVLLVDDDELVRASTAEMLQELGYHVTEANSAEDALALIHGGLGPDLVVTDHLMPGMTGTDLGYALREFDINRVLIVSGYADDDGVSPDLPRLTKPFRQHELAAALALLPTVDTAAP